MKKIDFLTFVNFLSFLDNFLDALFWAIRDIKYSEYILYEVKIAVYNTNFI